MTEPQRRVRVRVGNREYDKPYDPDCPACTSPMMLQLDLLLSYAWSHERILGHLRAMHLPGLAALTGQAMDAHVDHLAPPHADARRSLEADRAARGETGETQVTLPDMARLTMQRAWEAMQDGDNSLVRDAVALLRLQRDLAKDEQAQAAAGSVEQWQAAVRELLWIARKHLGPNWAAFLADLRTSEALRSISPAREEDADGDDPEAADRAVRSRG
jgi:hypothetical protein